LESGGKVVENKALISQILLRENMTDFLVSSRLWSEQFRPEVLQLNQEQSLELAECNKDPSQELSQSREGQDTTVPRFKAAAYFLLQGNKREAATHLCPVLSRWPSNLLSKQAASKLLSIITEEPESINMKELDAVPTHVFSLSSLFSRLHASPLIPHLISKAADSVLALVGYALSKKRVDTTFSLLFEALSAENKSRFVECKTLFEALQGVAVTCEDLWIQRLYAIQHALSALLKTLAASSDQKSEYYETMKDVLKDFKEAEKCSAFQDQFQALYQGLMDFQGIETLHALSLQVRQVISIDLQ
jgi:hypothetical protein